MDLSQASNSEGDDLDPSLGDLDRVVTSFIDTHCGHLAPSERPAWDGSRAGRLWANRVSALSGAKSLLEVRIGNGLSAVVALHRVPGLRYCGIETENLAVRSIISALARRFPGQVETWCGDLYRILVRLERDNANKFDRIRIVCPDHYAMCRLQLLEALRLCSAQGLILVE
jgi:hypothetical protein